MFGGFSAGAGLAIRLALSGAMRVRGFVAFSPALVTAEEIGSTCGQTGRPSGCITVGETDGRSTILGQDVMALCREHGIPCELDTEREAGHAYPLSFSRQMHHALTFVAND